MDILTLAMAKNSASSTPGQKGDTGNGIKSTVMNDDYTLTIEFTDGTSYTTPSIRGEKGETGSKGAKGDKGDKGDTGTSGKDGTNGSNGVDGKSITAISLVKDETGVIVSGTATLSDDSTIEISITTV